MNGASQKALLQLFITFINATQHGKRGEMKESADAKSFKERRRKRGL